MQRHEEALNVLMRKIFDRKLKAGDKFPTEAQLSKDLDIDKTSLRIALKQLESMQLLTIRQGDGIYVRDFMENAGIDFLRTILSIQEAEDKSWLIDEFIIDEIWEFAEMFYPEVISLATKRSSSRDVRECLDIIDEQLKCVNDKGRLVELNLKLEDLIVKVVNNLLITLFFNSFRPLREEMAKVLYASMDESGLRAFLTATQEVLRDTLSQTNGDALKMVGKYRELMGIYRQTWKETVKSVKKEVVN
jgi:DNA-binding FadR family transcriptional regulator